MSCFPDSASGRLDFDHLEVGLGDAAVLAFPAGWHIFPAGARLDAVLKDMQGHASRPAPVKKDRKKK